MLFYVIFSQNILKTFTVISNFKQLLSYSNYSFVRSHRKFKSELKPHRLSSVNFGTCVRLLGKHPDFDERFFVYDDVRCVSYVKHDDNPEMPEVNLTICLPENKGKISMKARVGNTVMRAIAKHNAENEQQQIHMESACEGSKACTTCHVYCDKKDDEYFLAPDIDEEDLLDTAPYLKPNSRLSCQMRIMKKFDHVVELTLPKATINFAHENAGKRETKSS